MCMRERDVVAELGKHGLSLTGANAVQCHKGIAERYIKGVKGIMLKKWAFPLTVTGSLLLNDSCIASVLIRVMPHCALVLRGSHPCLCYK